MTPTPPLREGIQSGKIILLSLEPIDYYYEPSHLPTSGDLFCTDSPPVYCYECIRLCQDPPRFAVWRAKLCAQRSMACMNPRPYELRLCKRCLPLSLKLVREKATQESLFVAQRNHIRLKYRHLVDAMRQQPKKCAEDPVLALSMHKITLLGISLHKHELDEAWKRLK